MSTDPGTYVAKEVERRMLLLGMQQKHLARAAGLNETYVRDLIKGKSKNPRNDHLARLAEALGCTVADLMAPPRQRLGYQAQPLTTSGDGSLFSTGVREIDVYAGMGGGGLNDGEEHSAGEWRLPTAWLKQEIRGDLQQVRIITLEGDSMAGTLEAGDKVVVDLNRTLPSPPGLFVVYDGMALVAKRLEYLEDFDPPRIRIISDNPKYRSYDRTVDEVKIAGRIMGRWQRLS
nr:helix-turn-helix domain-containing protein [uncultured Roseococcus sp.]